MKANNISKVMMTVLAAAGTAGVLADPPTEPYGPSNIQAQLRVNLEKEIGTVHFIRDNSDPEVLTKTYVLKYADPYELRGYIRAAVQSRRVNTSRTVVECIKYNDGVGMLIVSAEAYRFKDHKNGIGIDTMIERLDQPKVTASSGQPKYLYFPSYVSAQDLQTMVKEVGANITSTLATDYELEEGKDKVEYDDELNCLLFNTALYSRKHIEYMLKQYDVPNPEVLMKYSVYEIYAENDGKIGADFQAWKNNDGMDLLSVGGRFRDNWTATNAGIGNSLAGTGSNRTQYFNFNPKWNSRYLDFLTAKGKAKVVTAGEVSIKQGKTAVVNRQTKVFYNEIKETSPDQLQMNYNLATGVAVGTTVGSDSAATAIQVAGEVTSVTAVRIHVSINRTNQDGNKPFTETRYYLTIPKDNNAYFTKNGANIGKEADAVTVGSMFAANNWIATNDMTLYKGPTINTKPSEAFGFTMKVTPSIAAKATLVDVELANTSLIGWKSSGDPRIAKDSTVKTRVMIGNGGNSFIIGGLEKREVVRSVSGVPVLKDLPFLGFLFSSESESTKRSQLVLVAECVAVGPVSKLQNGVQGDIFKLGKELKNAGNNNSFGYDQWMLDPDKKADWDTF